MVTRSLDVFAPHVRTGIQLKLLQPRAARAARQPFGQLITYEDKKSGPAPPPPPRWPVYQLLYDDRGVNCRLFDLGNGRTRAAGSFYAGFVRMSGGGGIYVSPRPGVGLQGDSHPTIASRTPEWLLGQRSIVAGGEVGILDGRIVGHNDKTGHYQTRHNREQSGLPPDLFQPFTLDPRVWYKPRSR